MKQDVIITTQQNKSEKDVFDQHIMQQSIQHSSSVTLMNQSYESIL
jgi:hypothetical protein